MGLGLEQDGWQAVPQLCHTSFSGHIPLARVAVFIRENVMLEYFNILRNIPLKFLRVNQ